MSEIYFREFYRMQDEINERDSKIAQLEDEIAELKTELSNEEWINEQSRKEIDRLSEQIKSFYIGRKDKHIDRGDVTVGGRTHEDVMLDWLNTTFGSLNQTNVEQSEAAAELRLDLAKARAEIHRLNGLLDKREESAYTAMSEREKAEELRNELADLNADYEQLMMYYSSQRGSSRHTEAHIESLKEDLSAAREQRDSIQRKHDELVTQLEELVKENDEY